MSGKSAKVRLLLAGLDARGLDPRYAGFFVCFNRGQFYEAHDVLEDLWLEDRRGPDGDFFKGLIQFAGAFVHLQKHRLRPAAALFTLAVNNLAKYPSPHRHLAVRGVVNLATRWRGDLIASKWTVNPLSDRRAPRLELLPATAIAEVAAGSAAEPLFECSQRDKSEAKE
jgi:hypothetical protein